MSCFLRRSADHQADKASRYVIENVRGILDAIFSDYRSAFSKQMDKLGIGATGSLNADFRVAASPPRFICRAVQGNRTKVFLALASTCEGTYGRRVPLRFDGCQWMERCKSVEGRSR